MIQIQIIGKGGVKLQPLLRAAMRSGELRTFKVVKVKRGLKIQHTTYPGSITFATTRSILTATLRCGKAEKEDLILGAFVSRLVAHFRAEISAINIQP